LTREKKYTMQQPDEIRIIISGGGTGGHIFPAISIARALRDINPGIKILFVGAEGKMEMEKVPAEGFEITGLPVAGFSRSLSVKNLKVIWMLLRSLRMARKIIRDFRPHAAVGVGGYASGPLLYEAERIGIPVLIQEQNSYAGITNRLLAKKASVICVAYDGMDKYFPRDKILKTGNPVRHSFSNLGELREKALEWFNLGKDLPVILVLGGSLGAGTINDHMAASAEIIQNSGCQWIWQTGRRYYERNESGIRKISSERIMITGFIDRMDYAYAAADLIISRAGAGTISELCLAGKPVILIPSPNVAEDHQTKNALALSSRNAAVMLSDIEARKSLTGVAVSVINDRERMKELAANISLMADHNADKVIAEEVLKLVKQ